MGEGFLFCMLLEVRIATPVCALVRNDGVFVDIFCFHIGFDAYGWCLLFGRVKTLPYSRDALC